MVTVQFCTGSSYMKLCMDLHTHTQVNVKLVKSGDLPGSPVVRTPCFNCQGCGFRT